MSGLNNPILNVF